jgi:6-phosphofructokinase 1
MRTVRIGEYFMIRKKKIGILTGGGDVQPLNTVIDAAKRESENQGIQLIGFLNGWQGVLENSFVDLNRVKLNPVIGGTILRSSRVNLAKVTDGPAIAQTNLQKLGIEGIIVIGGEDTLSNSFHISKTPQILISKTIDNDVGLLRNSGDKLRPSDIVNHFTLGHPTAARKIASFVSLNEGVRTTAYSHERIIVVESMGMHAGWLALSSCMGKPDFIIVPEFPLPYESFVTRVADLYKKQRHVIVVIAEGARWQDGSYLSADETEKDGFGHPQFKGAASILAERLKSDLKSQFETRNVNAVNPSYLYRSGAPCDLDQSAAVLLGTQAVRILRKGIAEPYFLTLKKEAKKYSTEITPVSSMKSIEGFHRFLDERLYDPDKLGATPAAERYWKTIVGKFPKLHYSL